MLKSCVYCGKIHDKSIKCIDRQNAEKKRQEKLADKATRFRWTGRWKEKAEQIKQRDRYMCQVCYRKMYDTKYQYNTEDLSVHHIIGLRQDFEQRLCTDNLVTLCRYHHELADGGRIPAKDLLQIAREQESL